MQLPKLSKLEIIMLGLVIFSYAGWFIMLKFFAFYMAVSLDSCKSACPVPPINWHIDYIKLLNPNTKIDNNWLGIPDTANLSEYVGIINISECWKLQYLNASETK